jgi:CubicO group peptidase (beta-lactamase class C family)
MKNLTNQILQITRSIIALIWSVTFFSVFMVHTLAAQGIKDNWEDNVTSAEIETWSDKLFNRYYKDKGFVGGVISIVKDGETVFLEGYGFANYFEGVKADPKTTPFRSGSTSKVFTAIAIMQLVEKGKIRLDENVNSYLDRTQLDQHLGEVTVRDLLTHTAGYDERFRNTLKKKVQNELASEAYLRKIRHKQIVPSGERIQYSNYALGMLGVLLEDVTGLSYREYLRRNILEPLGMNSTYIETPADLPTESVAVEHVLTNEGEIKPQEFYYKVPAFLGSGGLFYTADDMATFMNAVLGNNTSMLDKKNWNEVLSVQESANPYTGVGYGFWIYERSRNDTLAHGSEATIIGHSGGTETFKSKMLLFPKANVGIFVALVGAPSRTFAGSPGLTPHTVTDSFINTFRGRKELKLGETEVDFLKQFEGNYYSTRRAWTGEEAFRDALIYESLHVFVRDSSLYADGFGSLNLFGGNPRKLKWISDRSFLLEDSDEIISFSKNGEYMNRAVYNNYDRVGPLGTPKALIMILSVLSLVLLSSFVLLFNNFKNTNKGFEILSAPVSLLAITTSFFQLLMFGVFRIHFRLDNNVFMIQNILGWSVLLFTILMTFLVIRDLRKQSIKLRSPRALHRVAILISLWVLNLVFVCYDIIQKV